MSHKRARGQFYTVGNPFALKPFMHWAKRAGLPNARILEPFAGANDIINTLASCELCSDFVSYDIAPANKQVRRRDTIKSFPQGHNICVTNPPWLARNSATRRGLPYPDCQYDNLYKHCLRLCLDNCEYVAALLPASYLQSRLFQSRLTTYILLHSTLFADTENPVCLALFDGETNKKVNIYYDNEHVGELSSLRDQLPKEKAKRRIRFNDPRGDLGFISFDNTKEPTIKFCSAYAIEDYPIKHTSRFITRISGDLNENIEVWADQLNKRLAEFRKGTKDLFLTPFKGMRADGFYRRRMHFQLARMFINAA